MTVVTSEHIENHAPFLNKLTFSGGAISVVTTWIVGKIVSLKLRVFDLSNPKFIFETIVKKLKYEK